jgi:hypothetical protein
MMAVTEFNLETIQERLEGFPFDRLAYYPTIGSTNDIAAQWAEEWAKTKFEGLGLVLADEQTAGRGRSWFTPLGRRWRWP